MYSSSTPTPSNKPRVRNVSDSLDLFDAAQERLHDAQVELVADDLVLAAGFDAGIVVHFDEIELIAALLHVDAVEPVADGTRGGGGETHQLARRARHRDGFHAPRLQRPRTRALQD